MADHPAGRAARRGGPFDVDGRWWAVLVGAGLAVVALVPMANANAPSLPFDDAYISFAYAADLVAGHGLRLSVGAPPVEAFSNPLWVLVLAIGKALGVAIPTWARVVDLALIGVLAGTTARLVRRLNPPAPAWLAAGAAALVVLLPAITYDAVSGLETLLFAALLNLVLLAFLSDWQERRPISAATTVACLALAVTRPEGALVWPILWAQTWIWCRAGRAQVRAAAAFVVPMAVLEAARLAYFGQLLPNSVVAKSGSTLAQTRAAIGSEIDRFGHAYLPVLVVGGLVLVVVVATRRGRSPIAALAPAVVGLSLAEVLLSGGDNYPYERYLLPLLAPVVAIAVAGLTRLGWDGRPRTAPEHAQARRLGAALAVVVVLAGTLATALAHRQPGTTTGDELAVGRGLSRIPRLFEQDSLADHGDNYQYALAGLLDRIGHPGQVLAADEVGAVSYYTNLRILDLDGLADTHLARRPGTPGNRSDPDYVYGQRPDFFALPQGGDCLCTGFADDLAYTSDPRFFAYTLVAWVPQVIPDDGPRPPVAVVQRDASITQVTSLDDRLPRGAAQPATLPAGLAAQLAPGLRLREVTRPTAAQVAAAPLALRGTYTAVVGADVAMALPADTGAHCSVEVTAVDPGSAGPTTPASQTMSLSIGGRDGASIPSSSSTPSTSRTTIELGEATVRTVSLAVPRRVVDPVLHLSVTPAPPGAPSAQWAEPRLVCR